jgi:RNA polymerase sigma-70 factor, ECF subfamily
MPAAERIERECNLREAVLRGDVRAWQSLYDGAFSEVFAYVQWRCAGLRDLAEDITQETWLIAVRRIRSFDLRKAPFAKWLCGIAANLLRNHFRASRPATNQVLPERATAQDREQERRERAERIARALAELPEHYEAVLRAKYLEQRSVAEIALAWGESLKTVESLLSRSRQAFRAAYGLPDVEDGAFREVKP